MFFPMAGSPRCHCGETRKRGKGMRTILRCLILTALFSMARVYAQVQVIPQVADGGGWKSTLVVTNTTASSTSASLSFRQAGAGGATESWTPTFAGVASTENLPLPAGSSLFLQTPGTAPTLTQGWAQLNASAGVVAYVIYTYTAGQSSSQGTAQAVTGASRILVPFDNTGNLATEIAVVNASASQMSISVNLNAGGSATTGTPLTLPGEGQMAFGMASQFHATAGQSGLAEFYTSTGTFAIIALQANTNSAGLFSFTTAPVYPGTGPPIISTGAGGGSTGGDIVDAAFLIGILNVTAPTGPVVEDVVSGAVGRFTPMAWNSPFSGTKYGPCIAYDYSYALGSLAPNAAAAELDPGTVELSGPNVASGSVITSIPSSVGPVFLRSFPAGTFTPGGTYTLSSTGGTQVKAFNVSATLPASFTLTNWNSITGVNRGQPLTLNWTGGQDDELLVSVSSHILGSTVQDAYVGCAVPGSSGTITIPAEALANLSAVPAGSATASGALLVQSVHGAIGTFSGLSNTATSFLPSLVSGGQANYGAFAPYIGYEKSVTIQ